MKFDLDNKVILIAGASQGIGFATALAFAKEGAKLAICSHNKQKIEMAAEKIHRETKAEVLAHTVDLNEASAIKNWVDDVVQKLGKIHVCVTNTGGPPHGSFITLSDAQWQTAFNSTFLSAARLSRAVIPFMQKQHWGRIIHLCSSSVRNPIPHLGLSNSLRAAVVALAKTQSDELAKDNILVNSILTGWTHTNRTEELLKAKANQTHTSLEEIIHQREAVIPLGRLAKPEEIAAPIVFLSSSAASFITGAALLVDGGENRFPF